MNHVGSVAKRLEPVLVYGKKVVSYFNAFFSGGFHHFQSLRKIIPRTSPQRFEMRDVHFCLGASGRPYQPGNCRQNILPFVFQMMFDYGVIGLKNFENIGHFLVGKNSKSFKPKLVESPNAPWSKEDLSKILILAIFVCRKQWSVLRC